MTTTEVRNIHALSTIQPTPTPTRQQVRGVPSAGGFIDAWRRWRLHRLRHRESLLIERVRRMDRLALYLFCRMGVGAAMPARIEAQNLRDELRRVQGLIDRACDRLVAR